MEVTFKKVGPTTFGLSLPWEPDRLLWNSTKDTIKANRGSLWDDTRKMWLVPFDHTVPLVTTLQTKGVRVVIQQNELEAFKRYLANQERIAELSFSVELPPSETSVESDLLISPLRPYQQVAVKIMGLAEGGFLNADPVGTGKSITCIGDMIINKHLDFPCFGEWDVETGFRYDILCPVHDEGYIPAKNQILFVTLGKLKHKMFREFQRHTKIAGLVKVVEGNGQDARRALWDDPAPIKIVSYETLLIHDWFNRPEKSDDDIEEEEGAKKRPTDAELEAKYGRGPAPRTWKRVYADEFSKVKNYKSLMNRRLNNLVVPGGIVGMTATPIEKDLYEYFNIMNTLVPGVLGKANEFENRHVIRGGFKGKQVIGYMNQDEISSLVAPHQLKRPKAALLPYLPKKDSRPFLIDPNEWETQEYERIANDFLVWVQENQSRKDNNKVANPLIQTLRLRQFLNSPHLVDPSYKEGGTKLEVLRDLLEAYTSEGEKVVVFTQWVETLDWIVNQFREDFKFMAVAGSGANKKPDAKAIEMTETFNDPNDDHQVFFCTDALSMGVDLYGASVLIHYDSLWNPAKMIEQREGRIHRSGQENPVTCLRLVTYGTIEESIENVLYERAELAEDIYSLNEQFLAQKAKQTSWSKLVFGKAS